MMGTIRVTLDVDNRHLGTVGIRNIGLYFHPMSRCTIVTVIQDVVVVLGVRSS